MYEYVHIIVLRYGRRDRRRYVKPAKHISPFVCVWVKYNNNNSDKKILKWKCCEKCEQRAPRAPIIPISIVLWAVLILAYQNWEKSGYRLQFAHFDRFYFEGSRRFGVHHRACSDTVVWKKEGPVIFYQNRISISPALPELSWRYWSIIHKIYSYEMKTFHFFHQFRMPLLLENSRVSTPVENIGMHASYIGYQYTTHAVSKEFSTEALFVSWLVYVCYII